MAEAVAIVSLIASIASLVDLSAKVISRLRDFSSKASDTPESFRSLANRLPLLTVTLQRIQNQAETGNLPEPETQALKDVVDNTTEQVAIVQECLLKVVPPDGASKLERAVKALKSLAQDDKVQKAIEKIRSNNEYLVLLQTTLHVDTGGCILEELTRLSIASPSASIASGRTELLAIAQETERTVLERHTGSTQMVLSTSNRELLFRFSRLPVAVQESFIARQEQQFRTFVEQEEATLYDFLTRYDTRQLLEAVNERRAAGTCAWALNLPQYVEWARGRCNRLCIQGGPGTGKTVLSAFIADALNQGLGNGDVLAVYACNFAEPPTTPAIGILCALAGQIAQSSPVSMNKCKDFIERHISDHRLQPHVQDLQDLIVEMSLSADIQLIFIVIDGLDEYEWEQLDDLMAIVDIPRYARKTKLLFTSRSTHQLANALHEYQKIELGHESSKDDVSTYISSELSQGRLAVLRAQDHAGIKEALIARSEGMFLYADLVIGHLSRCRTRRQLYTVLGPGMPKNNLASLHALTDLYKTELREIRRYNSAAEALIITKYLHELAKDPGIKTVCDLQTSVRLTGRTDVLCYTGEELVEQAPLLLHFDRETGQIGFTHFSVRAFLMENFRQT